MKNDVMGNSAKSLVMQPLFASKTQKDKKKEMSLLRKEKHKSKSFDY